MTGFLLGFLSICFVLSLIVVFHEFGHYITAKKSGILVREFSIGFGPLIFGRTKGETNYCVRAIPLGGYVDLAGMDENEELEDPSRAFYNKNPWSKMMILFAGSFMNFILAFLIYWLIYSGYGMMQKPFYSVPVVASVMTGSPAYEVGLKRGDVLLAVDSIEMKTWDDFRFYIQTKADKEVNLKIGRDDKSLEMKITPKSHPKTLKGYIGVVADSISEAGEVIPETTAFKAKFKQADKILKINGREMKYFAQIEDALKESEGKTAEILVKRDTNEITIAAHIDMPEHFGIMPPNIPIIGDVMSGLPAEKGGMLPNDRIVKINGQPIDTWGQMLRVVSLNPGRELAVTVLRNEKEMVDLKVTPKLDSVSNEGRMGISMKNAVGERLGVVEGANAAFNQVIMLTTEMLKGIKKLLVGAISTEYVQGPVGIAKVVKDQATEGFFSLLNITALISINIGLLNLFPIPGLDGGRIIFTFLEAIRRRRLSSKVEEGIHTVGIIMLLVLAVLVTYKDIIRLIGWN